ncbi:hypothetical protein RvY_09141 [Ramazzottius varieornatus]|uniref:Translation initiation factor eIF2B subunit delta n=1 Tax=Ramazzottius varieornatus TaxID=947166 RepID=A0A1D1V8A0_RAMVA|nr:hypothetical protein RvY_09141 [Ramazzottius varieornatus]
MEDQDEENTAGLLAGDGVEVGKSEHAGQKSKAQLRAERRAVQEAQRARKAESAKTPGESSKAKAAKPKEHSAQPKEKMSSAQESALLKSSTVTTSGFSVSTLGPQLSSEILGRTRTSSISAMERIRTASFTTRAEAIPPKGVQIDTPPPKPNTSDKSNKALPEASRQRSFNSEGSVVAEAGGAIGKLGIFSHLPIPDRNVNLARDMSFSSNIIHPAILKLGAQYANGIISGSNARCIALISALKRVICDYQTPADKILSRDLETRIKPMINFLAQSRPLAVSMGNAIRHLKWLITHIPENMPESEAKKHICDSMDHFVDEKIVIAGRAISGTFAAEKIKENDVILTYSCSSLVTRVLVDAHKSGKKFSVVVVDGRPKMEGRELLRRLVRNGVKCSYVQITAISYIMPEVTKILLGAECLLANGGVMSKVGSSQIALVAKSFNVPVLVCCETYKFCERVQTDSIVHNELGNPQDLNLTPTEEEPAMLSRLNLVFDVTPPDLITMVITEIGMMPCTSVPVVLRVKHALIK